MRDVSPVLIVPAEDIFPGSEGQEEHTENEAVNMMSLRGVGESSGLFAEKARSNC